MISGRKKDLITVFRSGKTKKSRKIKEWSRKVNDVSNPTKSTILSQFCSSTMLIFGFPDEI